MSNPQMKIMTEKTPPLTIQDVWKELGKIQQKLNTLVQLNDQDHDYFKTLFNGMSDRIDALEAGKKATKVDELGEKILAWISQYPGVKFNAGTISTNIDETVARVSGKVRIMANNGLLMTEKTNGSHATFWMEKTNDVSS